MSDRFRRNVWISTAVHVTIVFAVVLYSLILSCSLRKPKPLEDITIVDLNSVVVDEPPLTPVEEITPPEPAKPPPPKPEPAPIPEPVKKKKKKIEVSKKKVKRAQDEKPPPKPKLKESDIKKMLDEAKITRGSKSPPTDFPFAWYYALVREKMYSAWEQPSGLSASGLRALVSIRVHKDGSITQKKLVHSSGHAQMDESVMKAVRSVSKLKALPPQFGGSYKDITVEFELTGMQL